MKWFSISKYKGRGQGHEIWKNSSTQNTYFWEIWTPTNSSKIFANIFSDSLAILKKNCRRQEDSWFPSRSHNSVHNPHGFPSCSVPIFPQGNAHGWSKVICPLYYVCIRSVPPPMIERSKLSNWRFLKKTFQGKKNRRPPLSPQWKKI